MYRYVLSIVPWSELSTIGIKESNVRFPSQQRSHWGINLFLFQLIPIDILKEGMPFDLFRIAWS